MQLVSGRFRIQIQVLQITLFSYNVIHDAAHSKKTLVSVFEPLAWKKILKVIQDPYGNQFLEFIEGM